MSQISKYEYKIIGCSNYIGTVITQFNDDLAAHITEGWVPAGELQIARSDLTVSVFQQLKRWSEAYKQHLVAHGQQIPNVLTPEN